MLDLRSIYHVCGPASILDHSRCVGQVKLRVILVHATASHWFLGENSFPVRGARVSGPGLGLWCVAPPRRVICSGQGAGAGAACPALHHTTPLAAQPPPLAEGGMAAVELKVVMLGREYCGKTSLVERYLNRR